MWPMSTTTAERQNWLERLAGAGVGPRYSVRRYVPLRRKTWTGLRTQTKGELCLALTYFEFVSN